MVLCQSAGVVDRPGISARFGLRCWSGVGTEVAGFHRGRGLLTRIVTRLALAYPLEDVVQSENVAHLMDHGVVVTHGAEVRRVEDHSAWRRNDFCIHRRFGRDGIRLLVMDAFGKFASLACL